MKEIQIQRAVLITWNSQPVHEEPANAHLHRCTSLIKKKTRLESEES